MHNTVPVWITWDAWRRRQMETFSPLLAICAGQVTRSFDIFFDLCLNKRSSEAGDLRRHRAHYGATVI